MDYTRDAKKAVLENDIISAKEILVKLRSDIRYYHSDNNDPGSWIIEGIDDLLNSIDIFKKEELQ